MNALEGLMYGLDVVITPVNILAAFAGAMIGTAVGVLPGLGPVAGMALVMPLTFGLPPETGLIMLAGIYYGANYGSSTTAILINIPGEASAIATTFDGYPMTKRGRAGPALMITTAASFIAGTAAVVGVMFFAPVLSRISLSFGPPEYFALTMIALLVLCRISGGSLAMALVSTALGLIVSTVGIEATTGVRRFDFGTLTLAQGIDLVPVAIGLFGITEVFFLIEGLLKHRQPRSLRLRDLLPSREEWRRSVGPWVRGSGIGFIIGLLPGPATTMAAFTSYEVERSVSPRKSEFGKGAVEGVAGPEGANNAAATSAFAVMLSLGLPFSGVMAVLLAAMMINGVQPGPLLITDHPEVFWGVIVSMYLGNVMLVVLNAPLVGLWVKMLRIPVHYLIIFIVIFSIVGAYSVRNSLLDVWTVVVSGIVGYVLRKLGFPLAPLILAVILGPLVEKHFRESLFLSSGDPAVFLSSPIAIGIWILGTLIFIIGVRGEFGKGVRSAVDD